MTKIIPVFYACDDNYAPLLGTSIKSLITNASKDYFYNIHILSCGFNADNQKRLSALTSENSRLIFDDMHETAKEYCSKFHVRDYYSMAIYYRLFIANMFPQYDKAIYLDSDTIILGDVSKLYEMDLKDNLVAAGQENVMLEDIFGYYVETVVGVNRHDYFNDGVMLMNLALMRKENLQGQFLNYTKIKTFTVTEDQDYMNVLCKDRVLRLGYEWNMMPVEGLCDKPNIVHFKITLRPWKYDGVMYEKEFWKYAKLAGYYDVLRAIYDNFTPEDRLNDQLMCRNLALMAIRQTKQADASVPIDENGFVGIYAAQLVF
ncbi:MAG: glycosyltransferase family 8 protein [Clostridia bacterium]|nr:glycosyltransferase family 8 protein [Clostridia bacterium]